MNQKRWLIVGIVLTTVLAFSSVTLRGESALKSEVNNQLSKSGDFLTKVSSELARIIPDLAVVLNNPDAENPALKKSFHVMHALYRSAGRTFLPQIPLEVENTYANDFFAGFFLPPDDNPPLLVERLNGIVSSMKPHFSRKNLTVKIGVLGGGGVIGFAKGGEWVVVTDEMAKWPKDEIAGVLAHEICHLLKRDYVKEMIAASINKMLVQSYDENRRKDYEQLMNLFLMRWYRFIEYETDIQAAELMKKAGFSPEGLILVLQKLEKSSVDPQKYLTKGHPTSQERINALRKALKN